MGKRILISIVRFYQKTFSPDQGMFRFLYGGQFHCGMYPTCSEYMILSIEKYGIMSGIGKGIRRIGRCHPYQKQRVDFP